VDPTSRRWLRVSPARCVGSRAAEAVAVAPSSSRRSNSAASPWSATAWDEFGLTPGPGKARGLSQVRQSSRRARAGEASTGGLLGCSQSPAAIPGAMRWATTTVLRWMLAGGATGMTGASATQRVSTPSTAPRIDRSAAVRVGSHRGCPDGVMVRADPAPDRRGPPHGVVATHRTGPGQAPRRARSRRAAGAGSGDLPPALPPPSRISSGSRSRPRPMRGGSPGLVESRTEPRDRTDISAATTPNTPPLGLPPSSKGPAANRYTCGGAPGASGGRAGG